MILPFKLLNVNDSEFLEKKSSLWLGKCCILHESERSHAEHTVKLLKKDPATCSQTLSICVSIGRKTKCHAT